MGVGPWELAIVMVIMLVLAAGAALVAFFAVVMISREYRKRGQQEREPSTPLEIIQERYARGEINATGYKKRRDRLIQDAPGRTGEGTGFPETGR